MRYIVGAFGIIFLAFIAVILLVSRGPAPSTTVVKPGESVVKMNDFATKNTVTSLTVRGRLVGDTERRAIRMSVTPTERRIEILEGYNENVARSQAYPNTQAGYEQFIHALGLAGFSKTKKPAVTDERGVCPLGNQLIYDVSTGSTHPVHSWSTTCNVNEGTFAGVAATVRQLFQNQIPEYNKQVNGIKL